MATSTTDLQAERPAFGPYALAGFASLGGGAIHAAAIGVHAEHAAAARTFAVLAVLQLGWGALALVGRRRVVALAGLAISAAAVGGWVLAKTRGIGFVDGLGEVEGIQWPDALAALLAAVAVVLTLRASVAGTAGDRPHRLVLNAFGLGVVVVSLLGMTTSGSHTHAGGEDAAGGHSHGSTDAGSGGSAAGHDHGSAAQVAAVPYDPAGPIDLSGVAGVSPQQQARAENLVAITLDRLPKYADVATAERDGFASIHDAMTGHEHFVNWSYLEDGHELDPDRPESLVYEVDNDGRRTLVSAMFMLKPGTRLTDAPDVGGSLTQWHIHDDLCFTPDPTAPSIAGITSVGGDCQPPTKKLGAVPMIHVWITKNPCGPFAALEGIGAGQVAEGETKACDHAHGA